jgi:hypothetical protein
MRSSQDDDLVMMMMGVDCWGEEGESFLYPYSPP